MSTLEKISEVTAARLQKQSDCHLKKWERIRKWSRTDTARWLSDHPEPVLAQLRRLGTRCPLRPRSVGFWLKETPEADHALFDRAHAKLMALPDDTARERALVVEVLR